MPTPYATTADAPTGPRLLRPRQGRWVAGVSQGVAIHLGWPVALVRIGFLVLSLINGVGLIAYAFVWATTQPAPTLAYAAQFSSADARRSARAVSGALVPEGNPSQLVGASRVPASPVLSVEPQVDAHDEAVSRNHGLLVLGAFVALAGVALGLQGFGAISSAGTIIPILVIAAGTVLAWSQLDDAQRDAWIGGRSPGWATAVRIVVGLVFVLIGIVVLFTRGQSLAALWDAGLATLAVLAGAALIATPWIVRLVNDLRAEQLAAARANERADIAAHLHDSVLQTLALIQRRAEDPTAVASLARAQERELRTWLYDAPRALEETLGTALRAAASDVEDNIGVPIDLVVTGDQPMGETGAALVQAFREALLNAARHGKPPITAYVEIGTDEVEAFVKDRGVGFDIDAVPTDRLGVRESILGRMTRAGGSATVRRLESGTEVALKVPISLKERHNA